MKSSATRGIPIIDHACSSLRPTFEQFPVLPLYTLLLRVAMPYDPILPRDSVQRHPIHRDEGFPNINKGDGSGFSDDET